MKEPRLVVFYLIEMSDLFISSSQRISYDKLAGAYRFRQCEGCDDVNVL